MAGIRHTVKDLEAASKSSDPNCGDSVDWVGGHTSQLSRTSVVYLRRSATIPHPLHPGSTGALETSVSLPPDATLPEDFSGHPPPATSAEMAVLAGIRQANVSAAELAPGVELDGRYQITALIGEGGFGKVFGATDSLRSREVAVKVLSLAYNQGGEQAVARFVREAEITASLVHGNTIRVFDWGRTRDGQLFLIMERLRGESLRDRLDRAHAEDRRLGDHEARSIGIQTLQSLIEAHDCGLVHRDLKPANIYLHRLGGRAEVVKIIDFGIARQSGSEMTRAGQALGTPTHMSPEQAQGHVIDGRSDLYALSVVLFECLVGHMPYFDPSSGLLTMMMHVTAPIPRIIDHAPESVSPALAAVIERGLAKDADARFADAAEMRAALKAVRLPRRPHVRTGGLTPPRARPPTRHSSGSRRMPRPVSDIVRKRNRPVPRISPTSAVPSAQAPAPPPPPSSEPLHATRPHLGQPNPPVTAPSSEPMVDIGLPPPPGRRAPLGSLQADGSRRRRRLLHAAETLRVRDEAESEPLSDLPDAPSAAAEDSALPARSRPSGKRTARRNGPLQLSKKQVVRDPTEPDA